MNIIFDTLIYSLQANGGISRMYNELIPRIAKLDSNILISYLISSKLLQPIPPVLNSDIYDISYIEKIFRPRRIWQKKYPDIKSFVTSQIFQNKKNAIWHSTYFTDVTSWNGLRVVFVHDMVHELFKELYPSESDHQFRIRKKKTIFNSDVILCISKSTKMDLLEQYGQLGKRIEVIYLGASSLFNNK